MIDFEEIYEKYFKLVYAYILSLSRNEKIAEDITQETFFKAMKNIKKYNPDYPVDIWLCQIAKNTYFSMYKKDKRLQEFDFDLQVESFEHKLIQKDEALKVHKILHKLEEPYKEVFSLKMFGELSFLQIGEIFERNENWARVTFHRAKIKIREAMN